MRVKLGTSIGMTINTGDFQNIKVDTSIEIEKELEEDEIPEEQEKVYRMAEMDLKNKAREAYGTFHNFKDNLKKISKS